MENCVVTIVLPIYNVEKYLDRCINSVVHQTYPHLEILLVDDCSPDRCPQMCDEWAKKDTRIRVIHKPVNEGLGMARNSALDVATGKYICFLDSDDYLMDNAIQVLVSALEHEAAQLAIFGVRNIDAGGEEISRITPRSRTYRGREVQDVFLPEYISPTTREVSLYMSSCMILYSLKTLRDLDWRFVSEREIISEDVYSLLALFDGISAVTVVPEALYCYCYNEASLSRGYVSNRYEKIKQFYLETIKLCKQKQYNQQVLHRVSKPYLAFTIAALKQEAKAPILLSKRLENIKKAVCDSVLQDVLLQNQNDSMGIKQKILFYAIRRKWTWACFLLCLAQK